VVAIQAVAKIVNGVAAKYSKAYGIEKEDLVQELWLKILESGSLNSDANLIARLCYNRAIDIYRYERRRYDSYAEYNSEVDYDRKNPPAISSRFHQPQMTPESYMEVIEIIDLFPTGSRERKFVVLKAYLAGVLSRKKSMELEPSITDELLDKLEDKEDSIAYAVGIRGCHSGSYRTLKNRVKARLKEFLGRN